MEKEYYLSLIHISEQTLDWLEKGRDGVGKKRLKDAL